MGNSVHDSSPAKETIKSNQIRHSDDSGRVCNGLYRFESYDEKCNYLNSEAQCLPEGYINYLSLFYCVCGQYPILGYTMLMLWLLLLFYLLGNTAANYFCPNLEGLSRLLKLSPTIAGVTLLSLGNGAPDAFSIMVSFLGSDTSDVGLNSVLGGAFFVSSVVVGILSISLSPRKISIDKFSFVRDICFLLFVLTVVLAILVIGKMNLWGAMAFTSLYLVYVFLVSITYACHKGDEETGIYDDSLPLPLPTDTKFSPCQSTEVGELRAPLLCSRVVDQSKISTVRQGDSFKFLTSSWSKTISRILYIIELPVYLPRRLTIPDVSKERWSKSFAVMSVTLAPTLLAALWNSKREDAGEEERLTIHLFGGLIGIVLGIGALVKTNKDRPPSRFLLPWLAGGFLMSVIWAYIIAEELVSLLVSLGVVLQISSSVLGLTVLAWGNSLGDLIANVAVAMNGGPRGAQVAISGCYGGPIFNILMGLGLSLVLSSWARYPSPSAIPNDPTLYQTLGFLMGGLLWALVMVPRRGMRIDSILGYGLLSIYLCFFIFEIS
ncbi:cation/calcium exchanger 1-like isoform X2 [Typha latifolia]|uniref:cation/calcium exchanger 1-like isoform X2 n=1 Tax=Typha latifolia TaxID=4733 RepID=UPI003C301625